MFDREFRGIVRYNYMPKTRQNPGKDKRKRTVNINKLIKIGILIVVMFFIASALYGCASAAAVRNDPPASCRLFGGTWNAFSGWQCNG